MNAKIQEDIRTLKQFYPEEAVRHRVHSWFAHQFIPRYVRQNPSAFLSHVFAPGSAMDPTRFIQSRWSCIFEQQAGLVQMEQPGEPIVFRRVSDLSMSIQPLAGRPTALIQMPTPERPPHAFLVAVALLADVNQPDLWPRDAQARVFTLELTDGTDRAKGLLCEWTKDGTHQNYNRFVASERNAFLSAVEALLGEPETMPSAIFPSFPS